MKQKVLILSNHVMGIYKFRLELVEELLRKGYHVIILSPYEKKVEELVEMGCEYDEIKLERHGINPIKELLLLLQYRKQIKRIKPDVVLTYTIKPNLYGGMVAKSYKIPYIMNITGLGSAVQNRGILEKIIIVLYKLVTKKSYHIFFQNISNLNYFKRNRMLNKNFSLLPGSGVNLERYKVLEYPSDEYINFVFIGRIMKEKGIEEYLKAAKIIKSKFPNVCFHICGFCEEKYKDILKKYEEKGVIQYHGMVDDVTNILKISHCLVLPSYHEGMANVLLEAAASARAVIASKIPGCEETFQEGTSGFGIQIKDVDELVKKIEKFLSLSNDERKQMGLEGRKLIEQQFDRRIVINAYMKELKKIKSKEKRK